ncbi:MAG: tetratricopeptide repeat protein [Thermoanaerobaculia bacterium]
MKPATAKKILVLALTLLLTVFMLAAEVEAAKKKKKKKKGKKTPKAEVTATTQKETGSGLAQASAAVREANRHLNAYDTDAAELALDGLSDTDAWTVTARGRIREQNQDYDAAVSELRRAADIDTRNPAPVLFLGDSYAYSNRRGQANDAYAQAEVRARALLEAESDDPDALYYLGVAQQRQKRFDAAIVTLEKARSERPSDASILYQLGATRFYQDQFQSAFDLLSRTIDKNSGIAYAYYYRGLAAGKLERKDILFNDLDRFVKMAPNAPEANTARQILASFGG